MIDFKEIESETLERKVLHAKLYGGFFLKYHNTGTGMGEDWRQMRCHLASDLEGIKGMAPGGGAAPFCDQVLRIVTRDTDKFYPEEIEKVREGLLGIHRIYTEVR